MSADACRALITLVRQVLAELGARWVSDPDHTGTLSFLHPTGETVQVGLRNLVGIVAPAPSPEWPVIVRWHVEPLVNPDRLPQSADEARRALRIRLWRPDQVAERPSVRSRVVAPGLVAVLVVDLPRTVATVDADALDSWSLREEEAWQIAGTNTRREPVHVSNDPGPEGTERWFLT
jgi:hypothetical protein